jgi:hypothetical protein
VSMGICNPRSASEPAYSTRNSVKEELICEICGQPILCPAHK